jgi:L-ascorbate metabolism protein UlaG (beta-lactamase superfamily)
MQRAAAAITWLGHATVVLDLDGARAVTDPVLGERAGPLLRLGPAPAPEAVEDAELVLLSHLHADHADVGSLRRFAPTRPRIVAPDGAGAWLRGRGLENVAEMRVGEEITSGPLRVTATPALHLGRRWPIVGVDAPAVGYVVAGTRSVYFAGDTDLFDGMADLAGTIDVALLPVWGWGRSIGEGHLDPDRAAEAAARIAPRIAIPIHWGTLAPPRPLPRLEDPDEPARAFAAATARRAPDVDVRVLAPGERLELP